jgi:alpha-galactosidase
MEFRIKPANDGAQISIDNRWEKDGISYVEVKTRYSVPTIPEPFKICIDFPSVDIYSVWSPSVRYDRYLGASWRRRVTESRLASWMPFHMIVSADGKNRFALAISDAKTPISIATGVHEHNACLGCDVTFFTVKVAPLCEYSAILRIDTRDIPYYDSIYDAVEWWENECGYTPAYVPEHAKLPMNSLWYSYHQNLHADDIVAECALSKPLGMDTVIVDDGWQTHDEGRGYVTCGDWEMSSAKFPDMKDFVDRVHAIGMKVMLWYSVPFIGVDAKNYERFSSMVIEDATANKKVCVFDPRYKEVRDYLIEIYANAVKDWGLDGLKLDFIDSFALKGRALEDDDRRDIQSLEDAVDVLMTDISRALRAINPEIIIEFRQTYVGPAIRKYGNMLRVGDCPNDSFRNRHNIINLRFTSGKSAVHSDMVMWHKDDTVESAALQLASIIYGVPQISVRVSELSDEHKKMLAHYLSFWREHRDVLLDGKLRADNPESSYSIACSEKDGRAIYASYTDTLIECGGYNEIIAINSSRAKSLLIKDALGKSYRVLDCTGEELDTGVVSAAIEQISVPLAGMIFIK